MVRREAGGMMVYANKKKKFFLDESYVPVPPSSKVPCEKRVDKPD